MKTIPQSIKQDEHPIETTPKEHPFIEFFRVDIKTGEIVTDRRREVCPWLKI